MKAFENLLYGLYSAEVGVSDDLREELLARIRDREDSSEKLAIKKELTDAFQDPNLNWISVLDSKYFFVADVASNFEGRKFIIENVWKPLFPDDKPDCVELGSS